MSKSQAFALLVLQHYFQNASIPLVGDATGLPAAGTVGTLYVALHTADPGKTGNQSTNECNYTGYVRKGLVRSAAGWTCAGSPIPTASNAAAVNFDPCTGGSNVAGWFSVGIASAGASRFDYSGQFSTTLFDGVGAVNDTLTIVGHNFVVGDTLVFSVDNGEVLPAGITAGTIYFVKTAGTDVITISATNGGATLDVTAAGTLTVGKITTLSISNLIAPFFPIGSLVMAED